MPEFLMSWGTSLIVLAQSFKNPLLDGFFTFFTLVGSGGFYVIVIPVLLWCLNREIGLRLGVVLLLSDYVNSIFKGVIAEPRPADPRIIVVQPESSFSFPSAHAQDAVVFWSYLAARLRKPLIWVLAVILPLVIGASRIYLGVHFPHDVIGGWLIGGCVLLLFAFVASLVRKVPLWFGLTLVALLFVPAIFLAFVFRDALRNLALLAGFGLGGVAERRWVGFDVRGSLGKQAGKLTIGLIGMLALWLGFRILLPSTPVFYFARYFLLGLWVTLGGPWVFAKVGFAQKERH